MEARHRLHIRRSASHLQATVIIIVFYAGDLKKDGSEEMDHEQLPLIPNIAMSFHDAGYYTAHIGKWHLGGQTHLDIPARNSSNPNCRVPGILQYGFDEYVGMSEGTGSMRYHTHQVQLLTVDDSVLITKFSEANNLSRGLTALISK